MYRYFIYVKKQLCISSSDYGLFLVFVESEQRVAVKLPKTIENTLNLKMTFFFIQVDFNLHRL